MQEVERMYSLDDVKKTDPEIAQAIVDETGKTEQPY